MFSNPFSKTSFAIITGATRGYGLELAKVIAPVLCRDSVLVLTGRNQEKLDSAQKLVNSLRSSDDVIVNTVKTDLGVADDVEKFIGKCTENVDVKSFQSAVIIHNAGSLGDVTLRMDEYSSQTAISQHMDLNVSNVMFYTAEFLRLFHMSPVKCFVVNISTLCAVEPFPSCALYCTGKAARDMMFKVLAAERPDVRVVSWAPGPMPTDINLCSVLSLALRSTHQILLHILLSRLHFQSHDNALLHAPLAESPSRRAFLVYYVIIL